MAYLDTQKNYGDRTGGVSDPRLVRKVDLLAPHAPTTEAQYAAVEKVIALFARDPRDLAELRAMILPEERTGTYTIGLQEAA